MDFMPHGHCYYWVPEVLVPKVLGELAHVFAYGAISILLFMLARSLRSHELGVYRSVMVLFGWFIGFCASTHAMQIVTIWLPVYRLEVAILNLSGLVSVGTAVFCIHFRGHFRRAVKHALHGRAHE